MYICTIFKQCIINKLTIMQDSELEKQIAQKKKLLSDYVKLSEKFNISQEVYERCVDNVLAQLSELLKLRKQ